MRQKLKDFWQKYESKIILALGFVLVAGVAFQAGILQGREMPQNPLIIEKPIITQGAQEKAPEAQNLPSSAKNSPSEASQSQTSNPVDNQKCAFVGSKNSNKYHLPTCRYAKNINPENLVCFSSADEAKSKGYAPDKNCIK